MFLEADPLSRIFFVVLVALILTLIVAAANRLKAPKAFTMGFLIYTGVFAAIVGTGWAQNSVLPQTPILFGSVLFVSLLMAFSSWGARMAEGLSFAVLVGFHVFRLPLELILHHWAGIGTVPETMTWTGQNWDLLTGLSALVIFPFANRSRAAVWIFQITGFLLLLNVIRVALMSSALPFGWGLERPLWLIAYFPYALIAPVCVGSALIAHLIGFRKLLGSRS